MNYHEDQRMMKNDSKIKAEETNSSDQNGSKSCSSLPRTSSNTTRYGRMIKTMSPSTVILDSSKNIKIPKNIKQEAIENENTMKETIIMDSGLNCSFNELVKEEVKEEIISIEDLQTKSPWTLGQLVWAKIGSFPFWPGVVTLDPLTMSFLSLKGNHKTKHCWVHVRYCADKGRHSWVPFSNIIPFLGISDFERRSKEITPDVKKKDPKYAAAYSIKPSMKFKWDDAVAEASGLMSKTVEARIEFFKPTNKVKDSLKPTVSSPKSEESNKKRKQGTANEEIIPKKSKADGDEVETVDEKIGNNLSLETPPTPPSSHKDSSDEAPISRNFKLKQKLSKDGIFEIFCERNKELAEQLDPDASDGDIKSYLLDLWENMSTVDRSKYRGDYLQEEDMILYSLGMEEDEDVDSEQEADKLAVRQRVKIEEENEELSDQDDINEKSMRKQKAKVDINGIRAETSDQEETTSVESEILDKSARRRRTKGRHESSDREDVGFMELEVAKKRKNKTDKEEFSCKEDASMPLLEFGKRSRPYKLFKGMKNERVCQICETTGKLIRCKGPCYSYFHLSCVKPGESSPEPSEAGDLEENVAYRDDLREINEKAKESIPREDEVVFDDDNFKCIDCLSGVAPACFVCHEREGERIKCSVLACGKHYHTECLKGWPQGHWQGDRLTCPYHICHTCVSDNPQNSHHRSANEKFARCVRCPSTYHASISCLPAGSNIITGSQIVCPKHYKSSHPPVNATWCFLCTEGGSLICCDTCPTSFHLECLGIDAPDGGFICEDCETGRLPLYGEVVWVKLGTYRWWPSLICYPQEIPSKIAMRSHKVGEFCVMFLGTRDYYWVHRGKAFLFQDGDASAKVIGSKKVEESYRKALEEAKIIHERLMFEKAIAKDRETYRHLKPPPYVKLKVNKPVGNVKIPETDSMVACDCDPTKLNPCSPESDCLNRILLIECNPDACPAGSKCQNQLFVQRKYPAMKPVHTEERGWGLKTLEPINEGQFIIEYVGEIIDEAEYKLRLRQKKERKNENYYFLTIDNNRMIDAEPKGNLSRFMNHSCQPNCETQKWTVNGDTRIGLFALRDIDLGEELTFNYNLVCDGETRKPCLCKAPTCSGFIGLKVPKQQISLAQQKKMEKAEKVKKQKKNRKNLICWNCNMKIENVDDTYQCDQKTCGKVYHPQCIAIEDGPDQIFHCPWHFCAECYKRTSIRCNYCCNAFCQAHVYGNLREHSQNGNLICYNHPAEYEEDNDIDMGEALMDDDGEDEALVNNDYSIEGDVTEMLESSIAQSDEPSPRGAIVEVQPSSDEGDEEEFQVAGMGGTGEEVSQPNAGTKMGMRRDKQSATESDFTLDQIAAIIGIIK